ncbi:hypothetical protein AB0I22_39200 [Streptomyces sp. NPDC050610]|uniref:hypothetical protein n=1 Tax=Streptomyces sp. NPDC050610 TaxID=3157097 RepID=UPI00342CE1B9
MGGESSAQVCEGTGAACGLGPTQVLDGSLGGFHGCIEVAEGEMGLGLPGLVDARAAGFRGGVVGVVAPQSGFEVLPAARLTEPAIPSLLVRMQPGLTLQETLDRLNAGFDPDADLPLLRLTGAQRNEWERILGRVSRDVGLVESEEYLYSLTLETVGPPGRVQLDYCGDTAHIEVAYRYSGPAASKVMELAYRIARIVENESGLTGHDFEVGQPTRTGEPTKAAVRLSSITDWAQHHLG